MTPEAVADGVRDLLRDDSYRESARRIGRDIAAMPPPAAVAQALCELSARSLPLVE